MADTRPNFQVGALVTTSSGASGFVERVNYSLTGIFSYEVWVDSDRATSRYAEGELTAAGGVRLG